MTMLRFGAGQGTDVLRAPNSRALTEKGAIVWGAALVKFQWQISQHT